MGIGIGNTTGEDAVSSSLKWMKIMGMGIGNTTGEVALSIFRDICCKPHI